MPLRFSRSQTSKEPRLQSARRLAAAARSIRRQLDEVPLFPELVPVQDPAARLDEMDARWIATAARLRAFQAKSWREARAAVRALPPVVRPVVVDAWNASRMPGTGVDLLCFLRLRGLL